MLITIDAQWRAEEHRTHRPWPAWQHSLQVRLRACLPLVRCTGKQPLASLSPSAPPQPTRPLQRARSTAGHMRNNWIRYCTRTSEREPGDAAEWCFEKQRRVYLSDQEVHVLLDEHIQLFLQDGLHLGLTLAAQVGRSLTHSSGNHGIALVGDLTGQITGGLVDLSSLQEANKPHRRAWDMWNTINTIQAILVEVILITIICLFLWKCCDSTYSEGELVAPVLQFVVTGIEGEGLHDVGPGPEELPVQLSHWESSNKRLHHNINILANLNHQSINQSPWHIMHGEWLFTGNSEEVDISWKKRIQVVNPCCSHLLQGALQRPQGSRDRPSHSPSSPGQRRSLHRRSPPPQRQDAPRFPVKTEST